MAASGQPSVTLPTSGRLAVISGPSGVGKTVIVERLLAGFDCVRAVTATTRAPRPGEREGIDYYFYPSAEAFRADVEQGHFLEHAEVYGNYYGTPLAPIRAQLERGATVVLNIDVQGACELMSRGLDATFVFLEPPSMAALEGRLAGRGTDDEKAVAARLAMAREEMAKAGLYHHRVVNDKLDIAVAEVAAVLNVTERVSTDH